MGREVALDCFGALLSYLLDAESGTLVGQREPPTEGTAYGRGCVGFELAYSGGPTRLSYRPSSLALIWDSWHFLAEAVARRHRWSW